MEHQHQAPPGLGEGGGSYQPNTRTRARTMVSTTHMIEVYILQLFYQRYIFFNSNRGGGGKKTGTNGQNKGRNFKTFCHF